MSTALQFLRPCLRARLPGPSFTAASAHLTSFKAAHALQRRNHIESATDGEPKEHLVGLVNSSRKDYPRIVASKNVISCQEFVKQYQHLRQGQVVGAEDIIVRGRIHSFRIGGSKLAFIDVLQNGHQVQGLCEFSKVSQAGVTSQDFKAFCKALNRGDIISFRGRPHRTSRGQLSILLLELPQLLSPCLRPLPTDLQDKETKIRNRHVDFLVHPQSADIIRLRSEVIRYIRQFLLDSKHLEVQTPILADAAGGAVAKPFRTLGVAFPDRQITLRIAPELWLKRLVLGGFDRVFEIGPCFRNEGLDLTHNPEFTTCEFYRAYADLEELINTTEKMIYGLSQHTSSLIQEVYKSLQSQTPVSSPPFRRLDFVPALESRLGQSLPNLDSADAVPLLLELFNNCKIPIPSSPTLPRLLDKLSAVYLEPQCSLPTFITHHPECLSPLSKSFVHPITHRRVAARAELFIAGQEIVNTYEEENSPREQRRKFVEQLRYRDDETDPAATIDENYLQALEWGLPPTGGWGCGIDRICMLMSGAGRIGDVLSFGTLRNVVSLGRSSAPKLGVAGSSATEKT